MILNSISLLRVTVHNMRNYREEVTDPECPPLNSQEQKEKIPKTINPEAWCQISKGFLENGTRKGEKVRKCDVNKRP